MTEEEIVHAIVAKYRAEHGESPSNEGRAGIEFAVSQMSRVAAPRFDVHTVIERNGQSYWHKLGRGYANRDGSINLFLDALPINGKLQVRAEGEATPKTSAKEDA